MSQTTREAEQLVTDYVAAWNERAYDRLPDLVSESVAVYNPSAPEGEIHSREALEEFMGGVLAAFPDFRVTVNEMVADGDVVMYDADLTMTHEGEFDGVPPTGRTVELREMAKYRVAEGRIQEYRACFDRQSFLEQLGLVEG